MKNKLLFACCVFLNCFMYSQTFTRNYSTPTTNYQVKMDFSPQSWGDVYLDVEVKNTGTNDVNARNSNVIFISDVTTSLVNFSPNGSISYPTPNLTHQPEGNQVLAKLVIGLPDASWVDRTLSPNESFKIRFDLKTVTASFVSIADTFRFFLENEEPSLFTNVTTSVSGNDGNNVTINYKNTVSGTQVTNTATSSVVSPIRVEQAHAIWANDFTIGTTKYTSQYSETAPLSFTASETNNTIAIAFTKSTISTHTVTVTATNLPTNVSVAIDLKNNDIPGANKSATISNGTANITGVLTGNYSVTVASYTDIANNLIYKPQYSSSLLVSENSNKTIAVNFTPIIINEFTVKGFPPYLSHGTITNASAAFDDNFKNSPLSVIFKYSGLDGAGDRGKIPDMTPTKNTIEQARRLEASQGNRVILPVMVHYTANASGGGSLEAIKDLTENQNLYFHYRNLIQEIKVMLSYEDADHPNPGSFVISPDLIGAIQQDVLFGNAHGIRTMNIKVNEEVKRAFEDEGLPIAGIPAFTNNLKGYFQSVNYVIHHVGECKIPFGYQQNVWAGGSARWVFEKANEFSDPISEAILVADFMNSLELYTGNWKPDFIAFDRYERDCFGPAAIQNYAWSARHWDKYLIFCKEIAERIGNVPIMMWQIPGGHMATTNESITNYDIANHSSASAPYFLGDARIGTNINAIHPSLRNIPLNLPHYEANTVGGHLNNDNGYDWGTSNLQRLANMNVFSILWGGGSTTGVGSIGTNGDDDGWLAGKITDYYNNPPVFKSVVIPPYATAAYCTSNSGSLRLLDEESKELKLNLYPNPTQNQLQLTGSVINNGFEAAIYDLHGKMIMDYKKQDSNVIDISSLPKGTYIIRLNPLDGSGKIISRTIRKE